jgi:hypothetical protein
MIGTDGTTDTSSSITDSLVIEQVENEGNLREFDVNGGPAPIIITGSRVANVNQFADGFYKLGGSVTLIGSGSVSSANSGAGNALGSLNNANAVVVGEQSNPVVLHSVSNQWGTDVTRTGYGNFLRGANSLADNIGNAANLRNSIGGSANTAAKIFMPFLPTSAPGGCAGTGQLWNNSGVLTVC